MGHAVFEPGLIVEISTRNWPVSVLKTVTATLTGKKTPPKRSSGTDFSTDLVELIKIPLSIAEITGFRLSKVYEKAH